MAELSIDLINEIDKRINEYLTGKDILCRTTARVTWVSDEKPIAEVIFYGDSKRIKYKFPYRRNGLSLKINDTVYVESKINNLTSGIIVDKLFGMEE